MPSVDSGLEGPGIEPKPEEQSIDSDKGFARVLRAQPGGETLPESARNMGAANSPYRKAWVQSKLDESQKLVDEQLRSKEDFDNYMTAPGQGSWREGLTVPDDTPTPEPAAPSPEATAEIGRLRVS